MITRIDKENDIEVCHSYSTQCKNKVMTLYGSLILCKQLLLLPIDNLFNGDCSITVLIFSQLNLKFKEHCNNKMGYVIKGKKFV